MKNKNIRIILFIFLLLRVFVALFLTDFKHIKDDAVGYHNYSLNILENKEWLTNPDFRGNSRPPVYPLFLALIYLIFGKGNFLAVYLVQSLINALSCYLIYRLSLLIIGAKSAIFALIWSGFYLLYIHFSRLLLRETMIIFLLMIFFNSLFTQLKSLKSTKKNFWILLISYFLLIHIDSRYLFYLPFIPLIMLIYIPMKQTIKKYSVFLGLLILLMIPWTIRNYIAYDGLVLINTRTLNLGGKEKGFLDNITFIKYLNKGKIDYTEIPRYPNAEIRKAVKAGENPLNYNEQELEAIRKDIYPDSSFIGRKWFHFTQFWEPFDFKLSYRPFPDGRFDGIWSLRHNLTSFVSYGILLPFMLVGVFFMVRNKNRNIWFLIIPLFIQNLLHVILWANYRYRVPVDAFVIILGTHGMWNCFSWLKKKAGFLDDT